MITKACTKCGAVKKANEFSPDKTVKSGLKSQCKACAAAAAAARRRGPDPLGAEGTKPLDRDALSTARMDALRFLVEDHRSEYQRLVANRYHGITGSPIPAGWVEVTG